MTVFGSHGRARTDEFGAGDVGYVPQGYGHYIENTGDRRPRGHSRLQQRHLSIDLITAWMAANPDLLLATNFGVPQSTLAAFPKGENVMPD